MGNIITFTTDFGLKDSYQGAMKGAALSINPNAKLVDITHLVEAGNILQGAFILLEASRFFPPGTIHVAVVDPGVGGERKAVLVETQRCFFVGPDNGLLSLAATPEEIKRIVRLTGRRFFREEVSPTFHGRDIFAPVAAHLSLGADPGAFGVELERLASIDMPLPARKDGFVFGEIIYVDTFGNLITNMKKEDFFNVADVERMEVSVNGLIIKGLKSTYSSVARGEPAALISSAGYLEIAVNSGRASKYFNAGAGSRVVLAPPGKGVKAG